MKLAHFALATALFIAPFPAVAKTPPAQQLLIISDIHFNPLANPDLAAQLFAAEPDQWEAIFAGDPHSPAAKYGDDSTWPLLAALVSGVQNVQPKPQAVLVTGDILPHKFKDKFTAVPGNNTAAFHSFVQKTFTFIALELKKAAGGVPVIYTLGNNDQECGDYALQPDGPFLRGTESAVQSLAQLDSAAMAQWAPLGSYVKPNPLAPHHRILALNTNFWSRRYVNSCADKSASPLDPGEAELNWLAAQLKDAQDHGDKVWLAYHIPPGIDGHTSSRDHQVTPMWKPAYAAGFYKLLDEYRQTIAMNLAGHTHLDDIRLVKTEHATTLVIINPAVSPNVGQNPAFRLVALDAQLRIKDMSTWFIPLLPALQWQVEYTTRQAYHLKALDAKNYQALYRRIGESPALAETWKTFYAVSRTAGLGDNKTYLRSLYCATGNTMAEDYQACLSKH